MKFRLLLLPILTLLTLAASAQQSGIRGKVVSRDTREAQSHVKVTIPDRGISTYTDGQGNFSFEGLAQGDYTLQFEAPEFETLDLMVKVGPQPKELRRVVIVPEQTLRVDDSVFAEFDYEDASSDAQALPSSLSASKDIYNNIASYRFSEMRFNVRGYDSQYSDVYLNGIRFNDAMTGYGPWSLWSGLNDAVRNQESVSGLTTTDYGVGGIGGQTNVNARASQMRKGFRASVVNSTQSYRFRLMASYASGILDNGWSYAFSVSTRQGNSAYVDGIYYNAFGYFASAEKIFNTRHRLALTLMGVPTQRGAQQAATEEAYTLFGDHYYNPNVGYQMGDLRNSRVREYHEPIAMLNYTFDISERTRLTAAASLRFGTNGYSALTWQYGADPRPDYYRYMPSYYIQKGLQALPGAGRESLFATAAEIARTWTGRMDFDRFYQTNRRVDDQIDFASGYRSNYIIEERHTDQRDFNFAASISHDMRNNMRIVGGVNLRINRTEYYDEVKDLLGGDYYLDIDKFAERDMGSESIKYQNNLAYYRATGHAPAAREGDKISYDYYANVRQFNAWAIYTLNRGGFEMNLGGEVGYASLWRDGRWEKGLFPSMRDGVAAPRSLTSKGESEKLDYLTYKAKVNFTYKFSGAHTLSAGVVAMQNAPAFQSAFVSPRTRNQATPGIEAEKVFGAEVTYSLNLPAVKARVSGYYTTVRDQSDVISFYDDTQSSFTNFAMSGIDKRYYGVEVGVSVPIWGGLALQGALNWGDYTYTSDPNFVSIVDNSADVKLIDRVMWDGYHVESTPQLALNVGLDYRGPRNWFASVNFNYYDNLYLSMNPMYRTAAAVAPYVRSLNASNAAETLMAIREMRHEEKLDAAYTLSASVGKNWYIGKYNVGFSLEVKNILNDQDIRTGGYEQMRMNKVRDGGVEKYTRFPSKYFYMYGTNYYLNVYFRF